MIRPPGKHGIFDNRAGPLSIPLLPAPQPWPAWRSQGGQPAGSSTRAGRIFVIQVGVVLSIVLLILGSWAVGAGASVAPWQSQELASLPQELARSSTSYVSGEVLIGWQPDAGLIPRGARPTGPRADRASAEWQDAVQILEANTGLKVLDAQPYFGTARLAVPLGHEQAEIKRLSALPWISYAEPNYIVYAADVYPNDTYIGLQWNVRRIYAPAAWDLTTGDDSITVAVVDSGIDLSHPEFFGRVLAGYDYVRGDAQPDDEYGHGTHVAGVLAATADNASGIAGLAPNVRILPLKVLDGTGMGTTSNIAQAISLAAIMSARIINLSLQSTADPNNTLYNAVAGAMQSGTLIVSAAGNCAQGGSLRGCDFTNNPTVYPAAYSGVVAVAATDHYDNWASYSGYKSYVALAAPGGISSDAIWSTARMSEGGYGYKYGTSVATPLVSAAAALVWTLLPTATSTQVVDILRETADKVGVYAYVNGRNDYFGYGRLDVARAVRRAYPPALSPLPGSLAFLLGTPVTEQRSYLTLKNPSDQVISWQATVLSGADWLSILPTNGTAGFSQPGSLTVRAGPTALAPGEYAGRISITYNNPQSIGFEIPVRLRVAAKLFRTNLPQLANQYISATWIDPLLGGQPLDLSDNSVMQIAMPFPVNFYGRTYQSIWVSDNGAALFSLPASAGFFNPGNCMPSASTPNDALYVLWHDWKPELGGQVYVHQPDNDTFVVTWDEVRREGNPYPHSFQLVFYRDGRVLFQYRALALPLEGTIGIENYDGTLAQQILCNGTGQQVRSGDALLIKPDVPW